MALKQSLQLKLQQKLSPQQIQLMKLLQLPTVALEQRIKEEMEENPALEEGLDADELSNEYDDEFDSGSEDGDLSDSRDDFDINDYLDEDDVPSYKLSANNSSPDDERKEIPISGGIGFQDMLLQQLGLKILDDRQYNIAENIIGNIDEDGYLRRELHALVDDLAFTQNITTTENELEELLEVVQSLDPAGVGARTLQECLLLQLERKKQNIDIRLAIKIVTEMMDEFSKKHYGKIAKNLELDDDELKDVIHEITRLNPKPGSSISDGSRISQSIIPDFILINNDGELELSLNSRNAPHLRVSKEYKDMLKGYSEGKEQNKSQKDAALFVKQKLDSAKWFIDAIKQRENTLMATMEAIINYQYDYFLEGDETQLKPMILKDIADIVGLDISTISRVANSKYVQTPFGTYLLKSFFSEALSTDSGEEVSSREVKAKLTELIESESKKKPLSDDKLMQLLNEKGYNIARRTVAKYREQLNIPVARLRKEI